MNKIFKIRFSPLSNKVKDTMEHTHSRENRAYLKVSSDTCKLCELNPSMPIIFIWKL